MWHDFNDKKPELSLIFEYVLSLEKVGIIDEFVVKFNVENYNYLCFFDRFFSFNKKKIISELSSNLCVIVMR